MNCRGVARERPARPAALALLLFACVLVLARAWVWGCDEG